VYVNLVLPPAAPGGASLLRISVSAAHTPAEIDTLLAAFGTVRALACGGGEGSAADA
jgi:8-amino-7-oxononanoate synthase